MDYNDITTIKNEYGNKLRELKSALKDYPILSKAMAEKERDYLIAKQKAILSLKAEGMQVTLIPTVAKGRTADARLEFKVAESLFHACRENIKRLHAGADAWRSFLSTAKSEINIR